MPDSPSVPNYVSLPNASAGEKQEEKLRHGPTVRVTHWITAGCFLALLVTGIEILISHPRFYWGEEGNVNTRPLISIPIPSSRASVPTGYGVLPDQNGWSRSLHFQTAWLTVLTGLVYVVFGICSGHFRKDLLPPGSELSARTISRLFLDHLRFKPPGGDASYNPLQRLAYAFVIFVAFPLLIWTGLAMSPAVTSAWPFLVNILGGHQSARTLHFFGTLSLVFFFLGHIFMVYRAGFRKRTRAMIFGR